MKQDIATQLISRCSPYLDALPYGLENYEAWVDSEEEVTPGISMSLREVAKKLLRGNEVSIVRSALQALVCVGSAEDLMQVASLQSHPNKQISSDAAVGLKMMERRMKSVETLLDEVNSRETFIDFARALAKERQLAEKMERAEPKRYVVDGALDWKNADIASFIYAGLYAVESPSAVTEPSWSGFAHFLYMGKISSVR